MVRSARSAGLSRLLAQSCERPVLITTCLLSPEELRTLLTHVHQKSVPCLVATSTQ